MLGSSEIAGSNRSAVHRPLGEVSLFFKFVTIPQAYVFIILTAVGVLVRDEAAQFIIRFAALFYLILFHFVFDVRAKYYTATTLLYHLLSLCLLLTVVAFFAEQKPLPTVLVPVGGILLTLYMVRLPRRIAIFVCSPVLALVTVYSALAVTLQGFAPMPVLAGLACLGLVSAGLLVRSQEAHPSNTRGRLAHVPKDETRTIEEHTTSIGEVNLIETSDELFAREVISSVQWFLPVSSLALALASFGFAVFYQLKEVSFAFVWVVVFLLQLALCLSFLRNKSPAAVYLTILLSSILNLSWWALIRSFDLGGPIATSVFLASTLLVAGVLPLQLVRTCSYIVLVMVVTLMEFTTGMPHFVLLPSILFASLIVLKSSTLNYLTTARRSAMKFILGCVESVPVSAASIQALAWEFARVGDSEQIVVINGSDHAGIVRRGHFEAREVDKVFLRGLVELLDEKQVQQGVVTVKDLDLCFQGLINGWFEELPDRLIFLNYRTALNEQDTSVKFLLPISTGARIAGINRVYQELRELSALCRLYLEAVRTKQLSADVFAETQGWLLEQEQEQDQIVHHVNNIVQEATIQCDTLRHDISELAGSSVSSDQTVEIIDRIEEIDLKCKSIAVRLTDSKILKELRRRKSTASDEAVAVKEVLAGLQLFGGSAISRKGGILQVRDRVGAKTHFSAVTREFVDSALRSHLYQLAAELNPGSEVVLSIVLKEGMVRFEITDNVFTLDPESVELLNNGSLPKKTGASIEDLLAALMQLATLSQGEFHVIPGSTEYGNVVQVSFPECAPATSRVARSTGWVLLVDDKEEITTFYSRISTALNLTHYTAQSTSSAVALLEEKGCPDLVVTDLQLAESSGIELIEELRKMYGEQVKVIVVSGDINEENEAYLRQLGAVRCLRKPVGRRKLFSEIQNALGIR